MNTITAPKPVLKDGAIYFADNGRAICKKCAGASALYTGRDISGQKVAKATAADNAEWVKIFGESLSCESGCTTFA